MNKQKTENPNENDDDEELQSDQLQGVPDWLQKFRHGLVVESVPETPRRLQFFSRITFGAASRSGIGQAQYF